MTYNPAIPGPNDLISQSQAQIQTNFSQADLIFDIDHVTFDNSTAADRGKHRKSTYVEQATSPATAANEVALYSKDVAGSTRLFMQQESQIVGAADIQLSNRTPSVGASGETFLPGGLLIKWGQIAAAANGAVQNFPTPFPTNCFSVVVTINIASTVVPVGVNGFNSTGFTFRTTGAAVPITYIAIGN